MRLPALPVLRRQAAVPDPRQGGPQPQQDRRDSSVKAVPRPSERIPVTSTANDAVPPGTQRRPRRRSDPVAGGRWWNRVTCAGMKLRSAGKCSARSRSNRACSSASEQQSEDQRRRVERDAVERWLALTRVDPARTCRRSSLADPARPLLHARPARQCRRQTAWPRVIRRPAIRNIDARPPSRAPSPSATPVLARPGVLPRIEPAQPGLAPPSDV